EPKAAGTMDAVIAGLAEKAERRERERSAKVVPIRAGVAAPSQEDEPVRQATSKAVVPYVQPEDQEQAGNQLVLLDVPPEKPLDALKEMNNKHAVITNLGGKCVVMEWVPSLIAPGTREPSYQKFGTFRERYSNRYVEEVVGRRIDGKPLGAWWLKHPQRQQYEGIDLVANAPKVLPGRRLNLWRGFGVLPVQGDWSLIQNHIYEVLANGDRDFYEYVGSSRTLIREQKLRLCFGGRKASARVYLLLSCYLCLERMAFKCLIQII